MISLSYPVMIAVVLDLGQESNLIGTMRSIVVLKISWSLFLDYRSFGNQSAISLYSVRRSNYFCYLLGNLPPIALSPRVKALFSTCFGMYAKGI